MNKYQYTLSFFKCLFSIDCYIWTIVHWIWSMHRRKNTNGDLWYFVHHVFNFKILQMPDSCKCYSMKHYCTHHFFKGHDFSIHLEYSTDHGLSWHEVIRSCMPGQVGCTTYEQGSTYHSSEYPTWTRVSLPLPAKLRFVTNEICRKWMLRDNKITFSSYGDKAFVNFVPKLWNKLPVTLRSADRLEMFPHWNLFHDV